jgi:hypothetical protein
MWNDLAGLVLLPCAFYLGSRHGIAGIAWGWVIAFPLIAVPLYHRTFRVLGLSMREYMRMVWPALEGIVVIVPGVLLLKLWLTPHLKGWPLLLCEVLTGVALYTGTLALRHRERLLVLLDLGKQAFSRKTDDTPRAATS